VLIIIFEITYGGTQNEISTSIELASDGTYLIAGQTNSFNIGSGVANNTDALLFKIDASGKVIWSKTYGGSVMIILIV